MAFTEFVRYRSPDTGHEYDVAASSVAPDDPNILTDYPPNETGLPRPPKHRILKATKQAAVTPKKEK